MLLLFFNTLTFCALDGGVPGLTSAILNSLLEGKITRPYYTVQYVFNNIVRLLSSSIYFCTYHQGVYKETMKKSFEV
jgi:hypothetical protein